MKSLWFTASNQIHLPSSNCVLNVMSHVTFFQRRLASDCVFCSSLICLILTKKIPQELGLCLSNEGVLSWHFSPTEASVHLSGLDSVDYYGSTAGHNNPCKILIWAGSFLLDCCWMSLQDKSHFAGYDESAESKLVHVPHTYLIIAARVRKIHLQTYVFNPIQQC